MASKRRGGFGPPELRGTLGTLLRTTTGVVRDAIERGAREGRARLDDARANRRRHDALADLGSLVLDLIRRPPAPPPPPPPPPPPSAPFPRIALVPAFPTPFYQLLLVSALVLFFLLT